VIFIQLFLLGLRGQGFRPWTHRSEAQFLNIDLNMAAFADWQLLASNWQTSVKHWAVGASVTTLPNDVNSVMAN